MRVNPPRKIVWWISLAIGAVGLILQVVSYFVPVPVLGILSFWLALIAATLLLLATVLRGL